MDDYLQRLSRRTDELQQKSLHVQESIIRTKRDTLRFQQSATQELESLKRELNDIDHDCKLAVQAVRETVQRFRRVTKIGDLKRLQQKIDAWHPEEKLSKRSFRRMLRS